MGTIRSVNPWERGSARGLPVSRQLPLLTGLQDFLKNTSRVHTVLCAAPSAGRDKLNPHRAGIGWEWSFVGNIISEVNPGHER